MQDSSAQSASDEAPPRRFPIKLIVGLAFALPAAFLLVIVSAAMLFVWDMRDFDDGPDLSQPDGPYVGRPAPVPTRSPSQTYPLLSGIILETYDSPIPPGQALTEGQEAIVLARDVGGAVKWCVYAVRSVPGEVHRVRFERHKGRYWIEGEATLGYASHWTWWSLRSDGRLREYTFSQ